MQRWLPADVQGVSESGAERGVLEGWSLPRGQVGMQRHGPEQSHGGWMRSCIKQLFFPREHWWKPRRTRALFILKARVAWTPPVQHPRAQPGSGLCFGAHLEMRGNLEGQSRAWRWLWRSCARAVSWSPAGGAAGAVTRSGWDGTGVWSCPWGGTMSTAPRCPGVGVTSGHSEHK